MSRSRVACVLFAPVGQVLRVKRQAAALARDHDVTLLGYGDAVGGAGELDAGVTWSPLARPTPGKPADRAMKAMLLALGRIAPDWAYPRWYWRYALYRTTLERLVSLRPDVIVANNWQALPVALRAADRVGARVVIDQHEYAPRQNEQRRAWRTFIAPAVRWILHHDLPRTAAAFTVANTLARAYETEFGVPHGVVRNIPQAPFPPPPARPTDADHVRLVSHGVGARGRSLEVMVRGVAMADRRFSLDLMLVPSEPDYVTWLAREAERLAPGRVRIVPPVAPTAIVPALAAYDVGLFVLPPVNFNYRFALPNKFFEFIAAGLAVAIGPSPEMAEHVRDHGIGFVGDGFAPADVARLLDGLTPDAIDRCKAAARMAAGVLTAEHEADTLRAIVSAALADRPT